MKFRRFLSVTARLSSTTKKTKAILAATAAFFIMATASGFAYHWYMSEHDGWASGSIAITPDHGSVHGGQEVTISNVPFSWEDVTVTKLAGDGYNASFALTDDGSIYVWGTERYSGLGLEDWGTIVIPTKIPMFGPGGDAAEDIWSNGNVTIVKVAGGQLYAWGTNYSGQLGIGTISDYVFSPAPVDFSGDLSGKTVKQIVVGAGSGNATIALTSDGSIYTWGSNQNYGLGISGLATSVNKPSPTKSDFPESWGKTIDYIFNNGAVATDGTIRVWSVYIGGCSTNTTYITSGSNSLSLGSLSGKTVKQILRTSYNMFAVATDGTVHSYGCSMNGLLGDGTPVGNTLYSSFRQVDMSGVLSGKQVQEVRAYSNAAVVLADDGLSYYWGLFNWNSTAQTSPVAVDSVGLPVSSPIQSVLRYNTYYDYSSPSYTATLHPDIFLTQDGDIYSWRNIGFYEQKLFTEEGLPEVLIGGVSCDGLRIVDQTTVTCRTPGRRTADLVSVDITQGSLSWNIPATTDGGGNMTSGFQYEYEFWQDFADESWFRCGVGRFPEVGCESYDGRYDNYGTRTAGESPEFPLIIKNGAELASLAGDRFAGLFIRIAPDDGIIDLSQYKWFPQELRGEVSEICTGEGPEQECRPAFINTGATVTIDGARTTITGLNISDAGYVDNGWYPEVDFFDAAGLFSEIVAVDIRDLTFDSPVIDVNASNEVFFVGTLAAVATNSRVFVDVINPQVKTHSAGETHFFNFAQGGIIGYARNNTIVSASSVVGGSVEVEAQGIGFNDSIFDRAYIGGLIGYGYKAAVLNNYTDTEVKLTNLDAENPYYPQYAGTQGGVYFMGGLMGGLSLKEVLEVCLLNNYSRSDIIVTATDATNIDYLTVGGLVGYLEDWAVNNYWKGGSISVDSRVSDNIIEAALFGVVVDGDNEYGISRNYYDPADGLDAYGDVFGRSMTLGAEYDVIPSESDLLDLLQAGRPDALAALLAHAPEIPERAGQARIEYWKIENGQNDGYPIFGRKPFIVSLTPARGPETGGTRVTIEARNLHDDVEILIDGAPCNDITYINSTTAACVTLPHAPGSVDVTITSGGESNTLTDGYTYTTAMVITEIRPSHGPNIGGTRVIILGRGFNSTPLTQSVQFDTGDNSVPCAVISWSDTEIVCTTSAHAIGRVDVMVDNGEEMDTVAGGFIYHRLGVDEVYLEIDQPEDVSLQITPSSTGAVSSGSHDISVRTNSKYGYSMSVSTQTNDNSMKNLITGTSTLAASSANINSPAALSANTWGFSTPLDQGYGSLYLLGSGFGATYLTENSNSSSNTKWAGVPGADNPVKIKRTWEAIWRQGGDQTSIWYAAKADMDVPAGLQAATVTYTIVAETVPDDLDLVEIIYYWAEFSDDSSEPQIFKFVDYAAPGIMYEVPYPQDLHLGITGFRSGCSTAAPMIAPMSAIGSSSSSYSTTAGYNSICPGQRIEIIEPPFDAPAPLQDQSFWGCLELLQFGIANGSDWETCEQTIDTWMPVAQQYTEDFQDYWSDFIWEENDGEQILFDKAIIMGTNRSAPAVH